jgi:hypothetical protein
MADRSIGGADVLKELGHLANLCMVGSSSAQDAVAFALSMILNLHAEDRCERVVTMDDTYNLIAAGEEHLSSAVAFIKIGGSCQLAVEIIAQLARLSPDHIAGRN